MGASVNHIEAQPETQPEELTATIRNQKMLGSTALATSEPAEYELLWEPNRAKAAVHSIALSPNEKLLAVGGGHISGDQEIHLYYWTGGQWTHIWAAGDGVIDGSVLALDIDDLDGDGFYEIVAGTSGGHLYVYSLRTGNPDFLEQKAADVYQLVWRSSNEITRKIWSLTIDDLDEDTVKEIIVGAGDGIHVFEYFTRSGYRNVLGYSHEYIEVWTSGNFVSRVRAITTGDTDGDGFKEIIAGSEDHFVYIFENTKDEWSAYPPHADNAYVLKWDSGRQLFGAIQALAVGNLNPTTASDEIVVSSYGHGVFVFEKAETRQIVSTLLVSTTQTGLLTATTIGIASLGPASQTLDASGMQPTQLVQPIQPIQAEPIAVQPTLPIVQQPIVIQPVQPILPSKPIQLVEMPTGEPGLAITYTRDRTMTMTKLFSPIEPWENPGAYNDSIDTSYPIDIFTDNIVGKEDVKDPYIGEPPITTHTAMARKPDGILGQIQQGGSVVLDFGKFEPVSGGGNSAPDLNILLGVGPEITPIYEAVGTLQPVESVIPIGQIQPLQLAEPTATIGLVTPTEVLFAGEILMEQVPTSQSEAKSASATEPIQPDQIILQPIEYYPIQPIEYEPILYEPIVFEPVLTQPLLSTQVVPNVPITPIEPVQVTQPFLTPLSPVRTVTEFQPISPSITEPTRVAVTEIQPIQPLLPSDAIVEVIRQQSVQIAISQDGENFTIIPEDYIKEAEWTLGPTGLTRVTELEMLPSYVIDIDPVLVATQWDSFRYLYIKNTGDVNIYVDTAYGILYRPPAEVLSIQLGPMNLRPHETGSYPTEYDDRDVIILGTQDGRLSFYDYKGVQNAPRIYDTYEDSVFSIGTGIWDFVTVKDSPAQRGYLCGTYPAIFWLENNRTIFFGDQYWWANIVWNNLERMETWTFNEAVEIADPDGDGHFEIVAGSWDNNVYLFENIYNGTYYDAWSSPDLSHVETGEFVHFAPIAKTKFNQAPSKIQSISIASAASIPFTYRIYDETVDIVCGNTDGDEANEIIVATTRSILVFENRQTEVNPNLYELTWRGDFTQDANYEITGLALGDDLDGDGAPEIVVLVGNKLYVLESAELYVPPELLQPIQPILNLTNPKLQPIYVEPIATEPIVQQPVQPIVVQPIINPPVQQPIVQPGGIQPIIQPKAQQQQISIVQPSILQPATQLQLFYNHYIITYEWEVPEFANTVITRVMTEDIDSDGRGEIILAGISLTGVYYVSMMMKYLGFVLGLESIANDRYQVKWTQNPGPVTSIAVDDQDGNGRKELICGTFGLKIYEHTGVDDGLTLRQDSPTDKIGWVGALGVGDTDGDGKREILVAATNVSESGPDLPQNIISMLELRPASTFKYDLQFNAAFREPVNVRDMAIGDTNNNGYEELICSAAGGFIFSYEWAANVEITEIFSATLIAYPAYMAVYSEVGVTEAELLREFDETVIANATQIQQPIQLQPIYMVPIG